MRKIHLEPMIKPRPAEPSRGLLIAMTIALGLIFAASAVIVVNRLVAYDTYLKHERV